MDKVQEAQDILKCLGLPPAQQNEMAALVLLALCGIKEQDSWKQAKRISLGVTKGIMVFMEEHYQRDYAPNTRETVRRHVLHQFIQARLVDYNPDNPDLPTNSPRTHYSLSKVALATIQKYGSSEWPEATQEFLNKQGSLLEKYQNRRKKRKVPVILPQGTKLELSPGKHNEVQASIIHDFAPRFAPGAEVLYLGDTAKKNLFVNGETLKEINISITEHDKLPDVVLYVREKNWLYLIEAVTSHGPMSPKRIVELKELLFDCQAGLVFVSAFPNLKEFRKHIKEIAWDTEVWIADIPEHMIHYNGDRFLGPRE